MEERFEGVPGTAQGQWEQGRYSFAGGPTDSAVVLEVPRRQPLPEKRGIKAKDPEFVIGVTVLSVMGVLLVLAAVALFAFHFMTTRLLGFCMYVFTVAFILISELLIHRRLPKLGRVLTTLGIGGIYVATLVNSSRNMHNFSVGTGTCIAVAFTLMVLLYGWKRQISLYRVAALLFCYLCFRPGQGTAYPALVSGPVLTEFLILGTAILALNLLHALLPVKKYAVAAYAPPMAVAVFYTEVLFWGLYWQGEREWISNVPEMIFLACMFFVVHLYLYKQLKAVEREDKESKRWKKAVLLTVYVLVLLEFFDLVMSATGAAGSYFGEGRFLYSLCADNPAALNMTMLSFTAIGIICFALLARFKEKWFLFYFGNITLYLVYLALEDSHYNEGSVASFWCLLGLLVLVKILAFAKIKAVRVMEVILTFWSCIAAMFYPEKWCNYVLMAVLVLSVFTVNYWHACYESVVTFALAVFVIQELPLMLKPPVFVGILFVGLILVNHIKRLRGPYPLIYNSVMVTAQALSYLVLTGHMYRNSYITHLCMLVLGLGIITLILQERYHLQCRFKLLLVELFLAYMALVLRLPYAFITSILLMVIAAVGVAGGFLTRQKSARICGLVLSILVCIKIVLYDFRGGPALQRIFLYLAVGVLALVIAGIYIVLEKKTKEKQTF